MRVLATSIAATLIAGCAAPPSPPGPPVAQETAARVPGPAQACISTNPQQNLHAIDASTLAYGSGRTIFINRLGAACPGITPTSTLIVEPGTPGDYCRGDVVRGREIGASIPGPACVLSAWVPYRAP